MLYNGFISLFWHLLILLLISALTYQINVDDSSQYALSIEKPLKLPKGVTKKEIEVEFLQSTKSEEIIHKMYNAFEFQNDAVADASTFFRRVKDEDRYVELYNFIHE